jgi:hypothetical protein
MTQYRNLLIAMALSTVAGLTASPAQATPSVGFVGTQVAKGLYGPMTLFGVNRNWLFQAQSRGQSDIYVFKNDVAIGGQSGWHTHPGPSLVTVTVGEIVEYEYDKGQCSRTVRHAGEGIIDIGSGHLHMLRNESAAPAETVAVQFLPTGAPRRIDAAKPLSCPF